MSNLLCSAFCVNLNVTTKDFIPVIRLDSRELGLFIITFWPGLKTAKQFSDTIILVAFTVSI